MIKRLKFFRFLYYLCLIGAVFGFVFFGVLAVLICLSLSALFAALADLVKLDLEYPPI